MEHMDLFYPKANNFFVGLPASRAAAGSGYVPSNDLRTQLLPFVKGSSKYGGVMLWDRYNDLQSGYKLQNQRQRLNFGKLPYQEAKLYI
ncbi:hypothetical protein PTKIN_Ptkin15bG0048500 [Pterospermum kingtungense]